MRSRSVLPCLLCAVSGLGLGWLAASYSTPTAEAGQSDRSGEAVLTTGPVSVHYDPVSRSMVTHDAIYYLDYAGGRLLAATPTQRQTTAGTKILGGFAVRDLVADFHPPRGTTPRFLMTVGQMGTGGTGGWAPLFVFETTTGQVATYRVTPAASTPTSEPPPTFELVELKKLP